MKANELKEVIRQLVTEEVEREVSRQLPKLLFEMLGQKSSSTISENNQPKTNLSTNTSPKNIKKPEVAKPVQKVYKTYVKNPLLNEVLNETEPGLPQCSDGEVGVPLPNFNKIGQIHEQLHVGDEELRVNESVEKTNDSSAAGADVSKLFNKNFKAILNKSMERGANSGNYHGMIQNW